MELFTKEFHCIKDININYSPSISIYSNREIYTLYTYVPHPRTNRQKYEKNSFYIEIKSTPKLVHFNLL